MLTFTRPRSSDACTQTHLLAPILDQTADSDQPTVRQLKLAFQETPLKLREIEDGWRDKRKQKLAQLNNVDGNRTVGKEYLSLKSRTVTAVRALNDDALVEPCNHLPSPPLTPPELADRPRRPAAGPLSVDNSAIARQEAGNDSPRPIMAFPLSATITPMNIARGVTLQVPSPNSNVLHELRMDLSDQRVVVERGGRAVEWIDRDSSRTRRRIELDKAHGWDSCTKKQWQVIADLVERIKRGTPRVSPSSTRSLGALTKMQMEIYHPLGVITVTCSAVPDICLAYDVRSFSIPSRAEYHRRIRLVYSSSTNSIRISTRLISDIDTRNVFRTKRVVPLGHISFGVVQAWQRGSEAQVASQALGFSLSGDWLDYEIAAIERLWQTRDEWIRYIKMTD